MDQALEHGINFFDTANAYGVFTACGDTSHLHLGLTEEIIGPRTVEQLTSNLRAPDISISDETMRRLNEIWPGPGGEAPNAYAW